MRFEDARPLVSVVVTAFRRRGYLRGAVQSLLGQTLDPASFEVLVIKDFPDPEFEAWATSLPIAVRVVTEELPGIGEMPARGLSLARGEVVCFLDDDDRFRADKLSTIARMFSLDPDLTFYHNSQKERHEQVVDSTGRSRMEVDDGHFWSITAGPGTLGKAAVRKLFRAGAHGNSSSISVRRTHLLPFIPYMLRDRCSLDVLLFLSALVSRGRIQADSRPLTFITVHPSNMSRPRRIESLRRYAISRIHDTPMLLEMVQDIPGGVAVADFGRLKAAFDIAIADPTTYRISGSDVVDLIRTGTQLGQWKVLLRGIAWWVSVRLAPRLTRRLYLTRRFGSQSTA